MRIPSGSLCKGMLQCQRLSASQSALVLGQWCVSAGARHTLSMALARHSRHRWAARPPREHLLTPKELRAAAVCQQPGSAKQCHGVLQLFPGHGTAQNTQHLQDESCQQDDSRSGSDSHGRGTAPCQICCVLCQPLAAIPSLKGMRSTKGRLAQELPVPGAPDTGAFAYGWVLTFKTFFKKFPFPRKHHKQKYRRELTQHFLQCQGNTAPGVAAREGLWLQQQPHTLQRTRYTCAGLRLM